jgi:AcrR family transcriptional regulator
MKNKEIQEQRMKSYFIEAAKGIIRAEGVQRVSVRIVADKAGYSYATLYNYFTDVRDLIFECVIDFQEEAKDFITNQLKNELPGKERIKAISTAYINYFLEYPGIFDLFFIEKMSNLAGKKPMAELINSFLNRLCEEDWNTCLEEKQLKKEEIDYKKSQLNYVIIGMLLTYLHRHIPQTYNDFIKMRDEQISKILD